MKFIKHLFAALFLFSLVSSTLAQPNPLQMKVILKKFEKYVKTEMPKWQVPGLAVAIVQGDKMIYSKGFGTKTAGKNDPVSAYTVFQIGSTSKAFTSALVAALVDEGQLKWDDKVLRHLPEFKMSDPWVNKEFLIEDLMAQRSGLPPYSGDSQAVFGFSREHIRKSLAYIKPVSSFRSRFAYQNNLFLAAAEIVERKTGLSWEANIQNRIFAPLGMTSSSTGSQAFATAENVTSLHLAEGDKVRVLPRNWRYNEWCYTYGPAGGINSNVVDMSKWLRLQLGGGAFEGIRVISQENLDFLHTPKVLALASTEGNSYYCQGWIYRESAPYPIIWHNGGTTGCKTMVALVPQAGIGIVILSNLISGLPDALAFQFLDQYFGKPDRDRSGIALAAAKAQAAQEKAAEPQRPAAPAAPLSLEAYAGFYQNDVYGRIKVTKQKGGLAIVFGPALSRMPLTHFDGNTFEASLPDFDEHYGQAQFVANPAGKLTSLVLTELNNDGCGVFTRAKK
ncbi:MAG: serine hydrolase [Candidatus Margulisbacteria bacterium]|jgi:CubicO group peptidase (beta-lactamase class C family)|nr:serine hydrolase [Candidatus Margulisiibacteriota bacterium]